MDRDPLDFGNFAIRDALRRLANGQKPDSISGFANVPKDVISLLQLYRMAEQAAAHADLSRVSPYFLFDISYISLVKRHFRGFPRPVMAELLQSQDPRKFAVSFAFALFYWIRVSNPPSVRLNFTQFVYDCIHLRHGETLAFSIAGMLKDIGLRFALDDFFRFRGNEIMIFRGDWPWIRSR
jgi:hypothetical protein